MALFSEFAGFWTPVLPASEVGEKPVGTVLAGEKIVLFRGEKGIGALMDVCPHRGVSMALGKVVNGCLECPFHGWRFRADGACEHVPFNPDVDRGRLSSTALPVRELGGMIWVFTGTEAGGEPHVPETFSRPGAGFAYLHEEWNCHWTRAMENMLDSPHLPFVHASTIGRGMRRDMRDTSKMYQEVTETPVGFDIRFRVDDRPPGRLQFARPNGMELYILSEENRLLRLHVWCIPTETNRTRLLVASVYHFGLFTPIVGLFMGVNRKIVFEDRAVVESSFPTRIPSASEEKNVPTDKVTLRFRKWYFRHVVGATEEG